MVHPLERTLGVVVERVIKLFEVLTVLIGGWLTISIIASVFWRYVLNDSLTWVDESASLLLVWLMFAVAPIGFHDNIHIAAEILIQKVPRQVRFMLGIFINLCSIILFWIVGYYGLFVAIENFGQSLTSMPGSLGMFTIFIPIASSAVLLVCVNNIMKIIRLRDIPARERGLE